MDKDKKAKERLKGLQIKKALIELRQQQLEEAKALGLLENVKKLTDALERETAEYVQEEADIIGCVERLKDDRFIRVITLHYLVGMTTAGTAAEMCYTEDHIKRLSRDALKALDAVIAAA